MIESLILTLYIKGEVSDWNWRTDGCAAEVCGSPKWFIVPRKWLNTQTIVFLSYSMLICPKCSNSLPWNNLWNINILNILTSILKENIQLGIQGKSAAIQSTQLHIGGVLIISYTLKKKMAANTK